MGRDPRGNPFTPGFGHPPRVFAGRQAEFADLELMAARLADGVYEQPRLITADRGFGKTVLLREYEEEQTTAGRWVLRASATRGDAAIGRLCRSAGELLTRHDLGSAVARAVTDALGRLAGVTVGTSGVSVELADPAGPVDRAGELERLLTGLARLARERDTVLLLLVDEAQNLDAAAIADLFHAVQETQTQVVTVRDPVSGATRRDALPFGVVVAGLPGLVGRLKDAGSTFGERSKPLPLGPLSDADVRVALRELVGGADADIDADAVEEVLAACGGYPYFLHLYGREVWNAGTADVIDLDDARAGIRATGPLVTDFYEQRLRELGERQRQYLRAAAGVPAERRTPGAVAAALGATSSQLGSTQQALVDRHGLLRPTGDGRLEFTLPGLDAHLAAASA